MTVEITKTPASLPEALQVIAAQAVLIQTLQGKIDTLVKRLFGTGKNEGVDPRQMQLLLAGLLQPDAAAAAPAAVATPAPAAPPTKAAARKPARSGIPENLPVERIVLVPAEVQAQPEHFRQMEEVVTKELDFEPARFFWRHIVRPKFVRKEAVQAKAQPPLIPAAMALSVSDEKEVLIAPLPNRLIEKGLPGAGLLTHLILNRFEDHLPFYRLEKIFLQRHQVSLGRQSMVEWVERLADWMKPLYRQMVAEAFATGYLQVDETPVEYLDRDLPGKTHKGYFWVYGAVDGNVLFDWNVSRGREGPMKFLKEFKGTIQTDGYETYPSLVRERNRLARAAGQAPPLGHSTCWAHVRRKFKESTDEPRRTAWFLKQIQLLYAVENRLHQMKAGPRLREALRQSESKPVLDRIAKGAKVILPKVLPGGSLGKAIKYMTDMWAELTLYVSDGRLRIDNNPVENAIRPTAIAKKNFLFIGHPEAGWRSAVMYSIIGSCQRHRVNTAHYLKDILTRLPDAKTTDIASMTPAQWIKTHPQSHIQLMK